DVLGDRAIVQIGSAGIVHASSLAGSRAVWHACAANGQIVGESAPGQPHLAGRNVDASAKRVLAGKAERCADKQAGAAQSAVLGYRAIGQAQRARRLMRNAASAGG